ncbi:MAG: hypothetical protein AAF640_07545, partial [Pseudomonadota bacterium]
MEPRGFRGGSCSLISTDVCLFSTYVESTLNIRREFNQGLCLTSNGVLAVANFSTCSGICSG